MDAMAHGTGNYGLIKNDENIEIVAGIDKYKGIENAYPVFDSMEACTEEADVVIDFSNAAAIDALLDSCKTRSFRLFCVRQGFRRSSLQK